MRKKLKPLLACSLLLCAGLCLQAQTSAVPIKAARDSTAIERELGTYFESYANDLRQQRRQAIADRYDTRGYYRVGNGSKAFVSFAQLQNRYLNRWTGPKWFEWKDLSFDILSDSLALATGLFVWRIASGEERTISYSGLLLKRAGRWLIRMEDESISPKDWVLTPTEGDRSQAGAFKYTLKINAGESVGVHRHSVDMHIFVRGGQKFIMMGDLDNGKVQVYKAGTSMVIPANTWHMEWWEEETTEEISGTGPMLTEYASPSTPRSNSKLK